MSDVTQEPMSDQLSEQTSIFGLRLWIVVGVCVGAAFVLLLVLISLWFAAKRSKNKTLAKPTTPIVFKEIQEIRVDHVRTQTQAYSYPKPDPVPRIERQHLLKPTEEESPIGYQKVHIEIGKDHRITYPVGSSSSHGSGEARAVEQTGMVGPEVSHLGWGHWYTLRELEVATKGFVDDNVIGEGGYGIVYHGVLEDKTQVAVKNLLNNRGQAEREFKVEVEAIGRVRHKNLVRLLGFCAEGAHRMLVYEYVNNGNLEQWLHGDVGPCSPLTWEIRMNIILGTAKGLTYLHEGLEPKVIHRDIKSSNILLDKHWNAKVSDFGLAKLIGSEREFKVEVEAIGRVRHKNLVRLLGFCAEGAHRMLVYEYVNNGNLEQWLHGDVGPCSPLTWEIRMNIILKTAKGLTYLHEGLEPKVIHRDIKSSNILLDKHWNAKVSDFGLAKLIGSEMSYITTRVMGTFGYVAPEYASTGMLNERSDVYSFGILIMEILSGRNPVDYSRPPEEVNLVDWLKKMVADRNAEAVLDPKLPEKPASRALKRVLLVALRCVDPNALKRPKLGHIVHMLEAEESPFKDDRRSRRDAERLDGEDVKDGLKEKQVTEPGGSSGYESGIAVVR